MRSNEQGRISSHKGKSKGIEKGIRSPCDEGGHRHDDGGVGEMEEIHLGRADSEVMITAPIHSR